MTPGQVDERAGEIYREARFSPVAQAPALLLIRRLMGDRAVRTVPRGTLSNAGALVRINDEWRIYLDRPRPDAVKRFVALHEFAHWALGGDASERDCDSLAAALLLPREAFLRALSERGVALPQLARAFGATETCVALRLGETTDQALALITPATVRVRGEGYSWPAESTIRALAAHPKPGLRKTQLRDDSRRVALLVKARS